MRHGGLLAGAAAAVLLALVPAADAAFPGTNGKILYTTSGYAPRDIRMVCPDGSNDRLVKKNAFYAVPSPDGTKMVYEGMFDRPAAEQGVWVSNIDGSNPIRIVDHVKSPQFPSWSPDGKTLVWSQYYNFGGQPTSKQTIVTAPADGSGAPTPLFADDDHWHVNSAMSWTTDNQWIIFTASIDAEGHDLYKIPANGGTPTRLDGDNETYFFQLPATHPNSQRIMVHKDVIEDMTSENWEYTLGGTGKYVSDGVDLDDDFKHGDEWIDWSPDGLETVMIHTVAKNDHRIGFGDADGKYVRHLSRNGTAARWINGSTADCSTPYNPSFDKVSLNEIALSKNGSKSNRFVELSIGADQDFPTASGPYRIVAYDTAGARKGGYGISTSTLQAYDPNVPFTMMPSGASSAWGVSGHLNGFGLDLPAEGQACFTTGNDETKQSCLAWGCITNPVQVSIPRVAAPPDGMSASRQGVASTAFHVAPPTPKAANAAGTAPKACPSDPDPPSGDQNGDGGAGGGAGGSGGGGGTPAPPSVFSGPPLPPRTAASSSPGPTASVTGPTTIKVAGGAVTVTVACAAGGPACSGQAVLQTAGAKAAAAKKPTRLGSARVRVAAGRRAKVTVRLSPSARKLVKRKRRVKAQLVVTLNGTKPVTKALTIRR